MSTAAVPLPSRVERAFSRVPAMTVRAESKPQDRQQPARSACLLACRVALVAVEQAADKPKVSGGRWRLNAGSEMIQVVRGLNMKQGGWGQYPAPIRCVIDLASAAFAKPVIRCLVNHREWSWTSDFGNIVGQWIDAKISDAGIDASLRWLEARTDAERDVLATAIHARALVEQGDPMEASIGADTENGLKDFELVPAGTTISLNGRTYSGDGELPLYAVRNARIAEASLVPWGADDQTGQLAASLHPSTQDPTMTIAARIKALRAKHPNREALILAALEADKTDEQISADVFAAERAEFEEQKKALAAEKQEHEQAKLAASKTPAKPATVRASDTGAAGDPPPPSAGQGGTVGPKTFLEARAQVQAANPNLKGLALQAKVRESYPDLQP